VAVWGPTGAPGRTTIAVNLAAETAALGQATLLADVDTYGGAVAQLLGLLDEAPGLVGAARAANQGQLDLPALARHARQLAGTRLRVLTGITRTERWPEVRPSALEVVWNLARGLAETTVADCGFCLERDDDLSIDRAAPRRNDATLATLEQADVIVAVGAADPVGMQRLVRGLSELAELLPDAAVKVVVNRLRESVLGPDPARQVRDALRRYAGVQEVSVVPDDRAGVDAAVATGRTLAESAPRSPARAAITHLAAAVTGSQLPTQPRRRKLGKMTSDA
jgi:MinD-like ATPase involved in chromosome partitioning or flagellar assembly